MFRSTVRLFIPLILSCLMAMAAAGCAGDPSSYGKRVALRSQQAWWSSWHAVWQVDWAGAPLKGSLVAEIWRTSDGRLRIEVLEAPVIALSGMLLVHSDEIVWLYQPSQNQLRVGQPGEGLKIPLVSDALDVSDWFYDRMDTAVVRVAGHDRLESGPATRLEIVLSENDWALLWSDTRTGLPSRLELHTAKRGYVTFTARSVGWLESLHPGLFVLGEQVHIDQFAPFLDTGIGERPYCAERPGRLFRIHCIQT